MKPGSTKLQKSYRQKKKISRVIKICSLTRKTLIILIKQNPLGQQRNHRGNLKSCQAMINTLEAQVNLPGGQVCMFHAVLPSFTLG